MVEFPRNLADVKNNFKKKGAKSVIGIVNCTRNPPFSVLRVSVHSHWLVIISDRPGLTWARYCSLCLVDWVSVVEINRAMSFVLRTMYDNVDIVATSYVLRAL